MESSRYALLAMPDELMNVGAGEQEWQDNVGGAISVAGSPCSESLQWLRARAFHAPPAGVFGEWK